jgi:hypothetical protein
MDPTLKRQWIDALRSGKYQQGKKALRTDENKFCCLGVLCDISGKGEWRYEEPIPDAPKRSRWAYVIDGFVSRDLLPHAPTFGIVYETVLSEMNDEGHTFEEIADYIQYRSDL